MQGSGLPCGRVPELTGSSLPAWSERYLRVAICSLEKPEGWGWAGQPPIHQATFFLPPSVHSFIHPPIHLSTTHLPNYSWALLPSIPGELPAVPVSLEESQLAGEDGVDLELFVAEEVLEPFWGVLCVGGILQPLPAGVTGMSPPSLDTASLHSRSMSTGDTGH